MTDDEHRDPDDDEHLKAYNVREDTLEQVMPVLAEFFHIVRCQNHTKEQREQAYYRACAAWDAFEESYVRELTLSQRLAKLDAMNANHGEHGGEGRIGTKPDGEHAGDGIPYATHPGSRAIN